MKETSVNSYSPVWRPSCPYFVGERILNPIGMVMQALTHGISADYPPAEWPTTPGATITDGSVMWMIPVVEIPQPMIHYFNEVKYSIETGEVMGSGCKAKEATPKYEEPLIEEREV